MSEAIRDSLEQLRQLSPELNAATDQANAIIERVEKFLAEECSIGVPEEVEVSVVPYGLDHAIVEESPMGIGFRKAVILAYARCQGTYRFVVRTEKQIVDMTEYGPDDVRECEILSEQPWAQCPREVKLETFAFLPELLQAIAAQAAELASKAVDTGKTIQAVLKAFGQ